MQYLGKWAAGIVGGVLALGTLFYAANATSAGTYNSALFLFVVLIIFVFLQIKSGFDQAYKARHDTADTTHQGGAGGGRGATSGTAAQGNKAARSGGSSQKAGMNGQKTSSGAPTERQRIPAYAGRKHSHRQPVRGHAERSDQRFRRHALDL